MRSEEAGISMRLGSWPEKWAPWHDEDTDFVAALISSARESVMIVSASCAGSSPQCACTVSKLRVNKREKAGNYGMIILMKGEEGEGREEGVIKDEGWDSRRLYDRLIVVQVHTQPAHAGSDMEWRLNSDKPRV